MARYDPSSLSQPPLLGSRTPPQYGAYAGQQSPRLHGRSGRNIRNGERETRKLLDKSSLLTASKWWNPVSENMHSRSHIGRGERLSRCYTRMLQWIYSTITKVNRFIKSLCTKQLTHLSNAIKGIKQKKNMRHAKLRTRFSLCLCFFYIFKKNEVWLNCFQCKSMSDIYFICYMI